MLGEQAGDVNSREEMLRRVRDALIDLPDDERVVRVPRGERGRAPVKAAHEQAALADAFADRLEDIGVPVHRVAVAQIPWLVDTALREYEARSVLAPDGLPEEWLSVWSGDAAHTVVPDSPLVERSTVEDVDAVVTSCVAAAADSGAIVLDGGAGQGRRAPTLGSACHVCVVRADQVGPTLPEVMDGLDPRRPIVWFGGPGAGEETARRLVVLLVE
ncbi:LUD domain-containing protein [Nocardia puris]|uniref:L-lactate dehydrogenase complex protein LldG n=1 Tax=Nocardia puris TaxID=208602 RepID=A0A366DU87_9NOCA|nr:LUD domain-containing protein [Nocardia puris]MBF6367313.1 LUD domain-containing protein [Nocardia puris]MBF6457498.1 LUD domain-containing protein [Nocardia puris]RBO93653.1 L-lactate dehydrogenase complex protein LldG [Nocardia puris]